MGSCFGGNRLKERCGTIWLARCLVLTHCTIRALRQRNDLLFREPNVVTAWNLRNSLCEVRGIGSAALRASTISSERMKTYWVYIMSNKSRRLYVGFSSKLPWRVFQHKNKLYPDGFTAQYEFDTLVWCEPFENVVRARMREVEIKGWRRAKKLKLILAENPDWADLSREWEEDPGWKLEPEARPRIKRRVRKS